MFLNVLTGGNSFFGKSNYQDFSNSMSFSLSDYAGIKNGSYGKLMKSYYGGSSNSAVSKLAGTMESTATAKDEVKKLTKLKDSATEFKKTADELRVQGKKSVFEKVTKKNEDGTTTTDYDKDAIYKSINSFVEGYNSLMTSSNGIEAKSIERSMDSLVGSVISNAKSLSKVGITLGSDGKMKLDKDTFMKSDMNTVKSLFTGAGSFGYSASAKAGMINSSANVEANKANTYAKSGGYNYNYSAGSTFNGFV